MTLTNIIIYSSILIWCFPPFRQWKTKYFTYFLLLAVCDPLKLLTRDLFHIQYNLLNVMFAFFFVASLIEEKKIQAAMLALSLLLPVAIHIMKLSQMFSFYISTFIHVVMVLIVAAHIMFHLKQSYFLNLFLCMLMFYLLMSVFMRAALIADLKLGAVSYYLGGAIQILFGIAFIFINIKTKNFKLAKESNQQAVKEEP